MGGHGHEVCAPGEHAGEDRPDVPVSLSDPLREAVDAVEGAWLEAKGPILALHYRGRPRGGRNPDRPATALLRDHPGYVLQRGKMVLEIKPHGMTKARAIARLMTGPPFIGRRPVMVGDDATDEDGMREALDRGGSAIKVGAGDTLAPHRLDGPEAVWDWLEALIP